jgi:altronate dehydratase small subunit
MEKAIIIKPNDSVATVISAIIKGEPITYSSCEKPVYANADIPIYHKVAIKIVMKGEKIYKYGEVIGYATKDIAAGDHVHTHNLSSEKPDGSAKPE